MTKGMQNDVYIKFILLNLKSEQMASIINKINKLNQKRQNNDIKFATIIMKHYTTLVKFGCLFQQTDTLDF